MMFGASPARAGRRGSAGADEERTMHYRYAYEAVAMYGGRPAGWIGTSTTRAEAVRLGEAQRMSYQVRRVAITPQWYAQLASAERPIPRPCVILASDGEEVRA